MSARPAMFFGGSLATLGGVIAFWLFRNSDSLIITGLLTSALFALIAFCTWVCEGRATRNAAVTEGEGR